MNFDQNNTLLKMNIQMIPDITTHGTQPLIYFKSDPEIGEKPDEEQYFL